MLKKEIENKSVVHSDMSLLADAIGSAIKEFHEGDTENRSVIFCSNDGDQSGIVVVGTLAQALDNVAGILMHIHRQRDVDFATLRAAMIVAIDYIEKKEKEIAPPIKIPFTDTKLS